MNEKRRGSLRAALDLLGRAASIIDTVCDQESDAMDNYPENFQCTDRYESMEDAVDNLNEASDRIDEAKDLIEKAIG